MACSLLRPFRGLGVTDAFLEKFADMLFFPFTWISLSEIGDSSTDLSESESELLFLFELAGSESCLL
jgi:hypothetical protein